jgi:hypothetical protein
MVVKGVEIVGERAVRQQLNAKADSLLRPSLLKGLRVGARVVRKEVAKRTPKRSGALLRALRVRAHRGKNDVSWASVGVSFGKNTYRYKGKMVKPCYDFMIHNGTIVGEDGKRIRDAKKRAQVGKQRIKPNPFVYDAFVESHGPAAEATLEKFKKMLIG